jgi:hypothetical protein
MLCYVLTHSHIATYSAIFVGLRHNGCLGPERYAIIASCTYFSVPFLIVIQYATAPVLQWLVGASGMQYLERFPYQCGRSVATYFTKQFIAVSYNPFIVCSQQQNGTVKNL